jgi:hypothetical protein
MQTVEHVQNYLPPANLKKEKKERKLSSMTIGQMGDPGLGGRKV